MARSRSRTPITVADEDIPLASRRVEHVQGHWLLARLGKRVLRPGGLRLTRTLLRNAHVARAHVVEFAPGVGRTATLVLDRNPADYIGVDSDPQAAKIINTLVSARGRAIAAKADASGLPDNSADVVIAEGVLTIQSEAEKHRIVAEAARLLRDGGRYALHELSLKDTSAHHADDIRRQLAQAMHVHARPHTREEWCALLADHGLEVTYAATSPLALLEPQRVIADEGFGQALRFFRNVLKDRATRARVWNMAKTMRANKVHLQALGLVATKRRTTTDA